MVLGSRECGVAYAKEVSNKPGKKKNKKRGGAIT